MAQGKHSQMVLFSNNMNICSVPYSKFRGEGDGRTITVHTIVCIAEALQKYG